MLTFPAHSETLVVLDTHARIKADTHKVGSDKFYELFGDFLTRFEESGFNTGYLQGNPTAATKAYWAFFRCLGEEVVSS